VLLTDPTGLKIQQCFRPFRGGMLGLTIFGTAFFPWIVLQPPVPGVAWCPMHEYLYNTDLPPGQNSWGFDPWQNWPEQGNDPCWDIPEPLGACVWKNAPILFPDRSKYRTVWNNCQTSINAIKDYCRKCLSPTSPFDDILPGLQLK
jgi:hypothetical protein